MRFVLALMLALAASGCMEEALAVSGPPTRVRVRNRRSSTANPGMPSVNGKSFNPDGVNSGNEDLQAADNAWQTTTTKRSICFWAKTSAYDQDDSFVAKQAPSSDWEWTVLVGAISGSDSHLKTCVSTTCSETVCNVGSCSSSPIDLTANVPHFECSVYDGTLAAASRVQHYSDSIAVTTNCVSIPATTQDCVSPFRVAGGNSVKFYGGSIDEISYWSVALTQSNVNQLCCGTTSSCSSCSLQDQSSFGISGLTGYWRFDTSIVPNALDSSGNGHTLTANAAVDSGDFGSPVVP